MRSEIRALRTQALAYPGAHEDFPWGERVIKVKNKVFVFLGTDEGATWGLSVKLPQSCEAALMLPFAEPTGYGLGKAGWITARFDAGDAAPLPLLREWLLESYRAVAPVTLRKQLDGEPARAAKPRGRKKPG